MIFRLDGKRRPFIIVCALFLNAATSLPAQTTQQDWEKSAGGKQQFEVASVRQNKNGGPSNSNFSLDNGNAYFIIDKNDKQDPNGTLFSAKNQTLIRYIIFAWKLSGTQELALRTDYWEGLKLHVPQWVKEDRYDIEARTPQPATKDQVRLMMQSLLAERFNLQVHIEPRDVPIFELVMSKPGTLGQQLKQHPATDDCNATPFPDDSAKSAAQSLSALPIPCGQISRLPPSTPGAHRFGGRNVTLEVLSAMSPAGGVGINLAIQDAVAAARILAAPLLERNVSEAALAALEKRRTLPTRVTQTIQLAAHRGIARVFENPGPMRAPWQLKAAVRIPGFQRAVGYAVGIGLRPEHVRNEPSAQSKRPRISKLIIASLAIAATATALTWATRKAWSRFVPGGM